MALPVFDTEEQIPEPFRPEYVKGEDGKWRSKVDEELEVEKRKRAELLNEKKDEERKRKDAEQKLADAQRIAEAKAKGVSEEELERIRTDLAAKYAPVETEVATLRAENRKLKLTDRVKALALAHGVMADRIDDAMLVIEPRTDLGDANGIVWKNEKGEVTAWTPEQFFADLKKAKPWLFAFEGKPGGGSQGSAGRGSDAAPDADQQRRARHRSSVAASF